jgi:hypothetical protein
MDSGISSFCAVLFRKLCSVVQKYFKTCLDKEIPCVLVKFRGAVLQRTGAATEARKLGKQLQGCSAVVMRGTGAVS